MTKKLANSLKKGGVTHNSESLHFNQHNYYVMKVGKMEIPKMKLGKFRVIFELKPGPIPGVEKSSPETRVKK